MTMMTQMMMQMRTMASKTTIKMMTKRKKMLARMTKPSLLSVRARSSSKWVAIRATTLTMNTAMTTTMTTTKRERETTHRSKRLRLSSRFRRALAKTT